MYWHLWCTESLVHCNFGELYLGCNISLVYCIFGALHLWCYVCTFGMLCIGINGVLKRWSAATLVNYILVTIFPRCVASLVLCICIFALLVC